MEQSETIHGFNILKRPLTDEEKTRDITPDRIDEFHGYVGEDLVDQAGSVVNTMVFGGWLLHKYPDKWKEIVGILNDKYTHCQKFMELYDDHADKAFYADLCEFVNKTKVIKRELNQILIQVAEHYGS